MFVIRIQHCCNSAPQYTTTKSWRGYIFTAVCVCVCLSVCVYGSACVQIPAERMNQFEHSFHLIIAYRTGWNPIEIGDLGSKVKVTVTQYPFFLYYPLLTSLLCISAQLCIIKMKFDM